MGGGHGLLRLRAECGGHRALLLLLFLIPSSPLVVATALAQAGSTEEAVLQRGQPLRIGLPGGVNPGELVRNNPRFGELARWMASEAIAYQERSSEPLDITFSSGLQYQLIDWLNKDWIDAAVLSPMSVQLMRRQPQPRGATGLPAASDRYRMVDLPHWPLKPLRTMDRLQFRVRAMHSAGPGETWVTEVDPWAAFERGLEQVVDSAAQRAPASTREEGPVLFVFSSYLSLGLLTAVQRTVGLAREREIDVAPSLDALLERSALLHQRGPRGSTPELLEVLGLSRDGVAGPLTIVHVDEGDSGATARAEDWVELSADWDGRLGPGDGTQAADISVLVMRTELAQKLFSKQALEQLPSNVVSKSLRALQLPSDTREWLKQYRPADLDSAPDFRFTLPEVAGLVRLEQIRTRSEELALVLPGGGVKAAYQSVLVDHLYGGRYLVNRLVRESGDDAADPNRAFVKYVAGNSGGALLGSFVALMAKETDADLTNFLWKPNDFTLGSGDVFPYVDLMRWLSVFTGAVVFMVIAGLAGQLMEKRTITLRTGHTVNLLRVVKRQQDKRSRARMSSYWIACLLLTPIGFKYVNGFHGAEHVPALAGVFYFLCFSIAVYGDNTVTTLAAGARWRWAPARGVTAVALPLWLIPVAARFVHGGGAGCTAATDLGSILSGRWIDCLVLRDHIPLGSLLFCMGAALQIFAGVVFLRSNPAYYYHRHRVLTLVGYGIAVVAPIVATLLILLLEWFNAFVPNLLTASFATLELTGEFWRWFFLLTVALSLTLVAAAIIKPTFRGKRGALLRVLVFLARQHPSQRLRLWRGGRIILFAGCAWLCWNIIVAPALYGNNTAKDYLNERYKQRLARTQVGDQLPLRAALVVPSVSLGADTDRYALFYPSAYEAGISLETREKLLSDSRWQLCKDPSLEALKSVVFASGSPFPVFPAHRVWPCGVGVDENVDDSSEWLVDGGFAHNVPIEGPRYVGAEQLLIVASSPADVRVPRGDYTPHLNILGQLVDYLPRLIPFLYHRSQLVDKIQHEGLFIAELAPDASPDEWPILTSFRRDVVNRLIATAESDRHRRIGRVLSWGKPDFWRLKLPRHGARSPM